MMLIFELYLDEVEINQLAKYLSSQHPYIHNELTVLLITEPDCNKLCFNCLLFCYVVNILYNEYSDVYCTLSAVVFFIILLVLVDIAAV